MTVVDSRIRSSKFAHSMVPERKLKKMKKQKAMSLDHSRGGTKERKQKRMDDNLGGIDNKSSKKRKAASFSLSSDDGGHDKKDILSSTCAPTQSVKSTSLIKGDTTKADSMNTAKYSSFTPTGTAAARTVTFPHRYIVAPMVGASELPFRLLTRKYGAQLVYTPMMVASQFVQSEEYRDKEFQTTSFDRPLVCHFAANTPKDFAEAARLVEPYCDAIDLNLGCPQRTAYVGHFGSYLLDPKERRLVCDMVSAAARSVSIPIFCKIRLLDTYEETKTLCEQLYDAGASLIAVHGRYRATYHRKGPGARDGPALLDQIERLKADFTADERYSNRLLVTNGNTITYDDVVKNLELTKADGLMSAEGILDNPALFIGRLGDRSSDADGGKLVEVKGGKIFDDDGTSIHAKRQQLMKKLHKIEHIERKEPQNLTLKEQKKLSKKSKLIKKIAKLSGSTPSSENVDDTLSPISSSTSTSTFVPLRDLFDAADNKVTIALEYIRLVRRYPTTIRTVIFHTRRILKDELKTYQLMEDCLQCSSIDEVEILAKKIQDYQQNPNSFQFDQQKAKAEKEAIERKRIEEGKRKEFEARMIRKAKREGKTGSDLEYYLRVGTTVPTIETVSVLRSLSKEEQLKLWKDHDHSQHCMTFHLEGDCSRGRRCAFLHVPSQTQTTFVESDEVAG